GFVRASPLTVDHDDRVALLEAGQAVDDAPLEPPGHLPAVVRDDEDPAALLVQGVELPVNALQHERDRDGALPCRVRRGAGRRHDRQQSRAARACRPYEAHDLLPGTEGRFDLDLLGTGRGDLDLLGTVEVIRPTKLTTDTPPSIPGGGMLAPIEPRRARI